MLFIMPPYFDGMTRLESTQLCIDSIKNGAKISIEIIFKDANDNDILVHDDDLLMGDAFVSTAIINPETDLGCGYINSEEIRIKLIKNSNTEQIDWTKKIEVYFDVQTSAGTGRVLFGEYYGDNPNKITQFGTDIYEYVGYDIIGTLDVPADDWLLNVTFPKTVRQLLDSLQNYLGVTIQVRDTAFTTTIQENVFYDGCTIREVLHWLAEINGTSAISRGKNIRLLEFMVGDEWGLLSYSITPDNYYSINKSEYKVPETPAVRYESTTDPSKNVSFPSAYTGVPYTITDNPIVETFDAETVRRMVKAIFNTRFNFNTDRPQYAATSVDAIGNPFIQPGDIIFVQDLQGVTDPLWVFTHTFSYGAGTRSHFECTGSTSRQRKTYGNMDPYQVNNIVTKRVGMKNYDPVTGSFSGNKNTSKYYRVVGNGMVFIEAYTRASSSDDTGTITTTIYESDENKQNGAILSIGCSRLSSTATTRVTSNASLARYMTDGQCIRVYHACTKNGTNNWQHIMTTMGCQLEEY